MAKANPFRFSTKYQDDETDLVYYGYRYYNASTGRWLSRDPIGEKGGANLYGFVRNEPNSHYDIRGLFTKTVNGTIWTQTGGGNVNVTYALSDVSPPLANDYHVFDGSLAFSDRTFANGVVKGEPNYPRDVAGGSDDGIVGLNFASAVDRINIFYWNGDADGNEHSIFIKDSDIQFQVVPEPSVALLLAVAGITLAAKRRRPTAY